jgi:hypothetical protein
VIATQLIKTSKIGKVSAKGINYAQLRLPRDYEDVIGATAKIFATNYDGNQAVLIVAEHNVPSCTSVVKKLVKIL